VSRLLRWIALLGGLLSCVSSLAREAAPATAETQPGPELSVSVLTFSPGVLVWERFGHNALLLRNHRTGVSAVFNYGVFDFQQEHFFLNFARGRMEYQLDAASLEDTLDWYSQEGRWIEEQELALTPEQLLAVGRFLQHNLAPGHREYRYDYFRDNCSTRVRDLLNEVMGGALAAQLRGVMTPASYRGEALRLMSPDAALALGMDLLLGHAADAPLDLWARSFVPGEFMAALRTVQVDDGHGGRQPLVRAQRRLLDLPAPEGPATAPRWWPVLLLVGLSLAALLVLLARPRHARIARRAAATVIVGLCAAFGLAGLLLISLWLFTDHWAAADNLTLAILHPLWWLLIPAGIGLGRGRRPLALTAVRISATLLVVALGGLATGALLGWPIAAATALLLPLQLAIWLCMRRAVSTA
jgi:hypothetical protein